MMSVGQKRKKGNSRLVGGAAHVCTTAPYLVVPNLLCVAGCCGCPRPDENRPCRTSSKDQYSTEMMNVAR